MRDVLIVGNNWDGTADVIDVRTYQRVRRVNVIPDKNARLAEIYLDPIRPAALSVISYAAETGVTRVPVGDHPQRPRTAQIAEAVLR